MKNKEKFSFNIFNMMFMVSIALLLSFLLAFFIINGHIENLQRDTVNYYSILIKESLDKNITYSKEIDNKENELLYYISKMISEELSDIKLEDLNLDYLNMIKKEHNIDGLAIIINSGPHGTIKISTTTAENGETT